MADATRSTSCCPRRASPSAVDGGAGRGACPSTARPRATSIYEELAAERPVVGMTTFPNTVLLRGPKTILVDPGMPPAEPAGHQGARGPRAGRRRPRLHRPHARPSRPRRRLRRRAWRRWSSTSSSSTTPTGRWWPGCCLLPRLRLLSGDEGELAPGHHLGAHAGPHRRRRRATGSRPPTAWSCSPATPSARCATTTNAIAAGDGAGPDRVLLASWRAIASWGATLLVAGHVPPFAPARSRAGARADRARPCARLRRRAQTTPRSRPLPIYEYRCDACGHTFEVFQKFATTPSRAARSAAATSPRCCTRWPSTSRARASTRPTTARGSKKARAAGEPAPRPPTSPSPPRPSPSRRQAAPATAKRRRGRRRRSRRRNAGHRQGRLSPRRSRRRHDGARRERVTSVRATERRSCAAGARQPAQPGERRHARPAVAQPDRRRHPPRAREARRGRHPLRRPQALRPPRARLRLAGHSDVLDACSSILQEMVGTSLRRLDVLADFTLSDNAFIVVLSPPRRAKEIAATTSRPSAAASTSACSRCS